MLVDLQAFFAFVAGNQLDLASERPLDVVTMHSNRIFRTFGADEKQKSAAINNLHAISNQPFGCSRRASKLLTGLG
jgi:hypothetical protein